MIVGSSRRLVHLGGVAVQLLTRIPVPVRRVDDADLRAAAVFFPVVGLLVALVGIAVRAIGAPLVGVVPATILAVAATIAVTGAFHEDGLADSVDGLWGGWTAERRLEIMRDSRLGTYGAAALFLALALRVALLTPLGLGTFAAAEIAGHVLGRAAGVVLAGLLPAVAESGLGAKVVGPAGVRSMIGVLGASGAAAVVGAGGPAWAVLLLAATALAVLAVRRLARRRLGGLTGDLLGAANQMGYLAVLLAVVALDRAGWR